jgi:predicted alpha/beta-hydrolase family hydrolase
MPQPAQPLRIEIGNDSVAGVLQQGDEAHAALVLAHGAGAGMEHPFMASLSSALATHGVTTLRFQFPYMEHGSKRPDTPAVAHAAIRAAVAEAARRVPSLPLYAGGKSFGGRMTSQAQAKEALPGVRGLVFVGFPLHPAKKPGVERAAHLAQVKLPMLFLQGTRDALAEWGLIEPAVRALGNDATLERIEGADHAFAVRARDAPVPRDVMRELAQAIARWTGRAA